MKTDIVDRWWGKEGDPAKGIPQRPGKQRAWLQIETLFQIACKENKFRNKAIQTLEKQMVIKTQLS